MIPIMDAMVARVATAVGELYLSCVYPKLCA